MVRPLDEEGFIPSYKSDKLLAADAVDIRRLYNIDGLSLVEIAERYGVKKMTIKRVVDGKGWKSTCE